MYILAIETTGKYCSVAIASEDGLQGEKISFEPMNHLSNLTPLIKVILKECGIESKDIDAVAVSAGPGSFTGIRIGVATARALSQSLKIPCIAVNTQKAFGKALIESCQSEFNLWACPIFDARRNEIYGGCFGINKEEEHETETLVEVKPGGAEEFLSEVRREMEKRGEKPSLIFGGDGLKVYGDLIEAWCKEKNITALFSEKLQSAAQVALEAVGKVEKKEFKDFEDLKPDYMRKPEAQRNLEKNCIEYRVWRAADIEPISLLEKNIFTEPWPYESIYKEFYENPKALYVTASFGSQVIGYGGCWILDWEGHITNIAVRKDFRKRGIGLKLVEKLIEEGIKRGASSYTLEVRESNRPARKLYEKTGFKVVGERPGYYGPEGEAAIIMWKK